MHYVCDGISDLEIGLFRDLCVSECEEGMGVREQCLLNVLDEIKVERQAYHGNVFVGNHCKLVLKNHQLLCSVVSDKPCIHGKLIDLFGIFAEIQPLLFSKILTNEQVAQVKELCTRFGEKYPIHFPDESITRKIHELVFDVPRFLEKHRLIGRMTEEEGESLHNSVNQEIRQLASVRDPNNACNLSFSDRSYWVMQIDLS